MTIDYDAIRAENISRYGWDTAVLELLGQLYSDRTHFIFELIQNAEDAGATELTFELFEDRLEVSHDGRPFTEADVRGICGVGQSAKADDLSQIGRFGIGFKSVYAYTSGPRILSAGESFRIELYVRPHGEAGEAGGGAGTGTRFIFPFDRPEVPPDVAVPEIAAALAAIDASTLLFLRGIERLRTCGVATPDTLTRRQCAPHGRAGRRVTLTRRRADGQGEGGQRTEEWLAWDRSLDALGEPELRAEIAFAVAPGPGRLARLDSAPLVVFFPTQKETFLGFLLQGPYRTTPARDNVPDHDPWNEALTGQAARLLTGVLTELRDDGLLSVDVLQAMPLDPARFAPGTMLGPLYEAVREALAQEELIPAAGGYRAARAVRLTTSRGLRELVSPDQLGELCGAGTPVAFADAAITGTGTPALWQYLREQAGVDELTPRALADALTPGFLAAQPDEWIGRLYAFLHQHPSLSREATGPDEEPGPIRSVPVIRLEDGSQALPFDQRGRPAAYLPGPEQAGPEPGGPELGGFRIVRRAVAAQPGARDFLASLGFAEPDVVAEVLDDVLPRYADADVDDVEPAQRDADLELIARALALAPAQDRARLLDQVRQTTFVLGENAATGERRLLRPADLYLRTKALETYFDGNPDAWLADDGYGPWLAQLREMGVPDEVRLEARPADSLGYVLVTEDFARNERGVAGFDPQATLDGLEHALAHPSAARSEYVWNALLVPRRHLVAGIVERSPRRSFADAVPEVARSPIGEAAASAAWLPDPGGGFSRPADLDLADLPPPYLRDEGLASALGMARPEIEEASRQLGFPPGFLRQLSRHPDLVASVAAELATRSARSGADGC